MEIESFLLVSSNENRVAGIAPSLTQSSAVVVTFEYQGVYVYDVPTQQCLTSWLLSPGMKLTTHATLHSASGTFLAVLDNKTLLSWKVGVKDFKNVDRHTFPQGLIHSINVSANLNAHFVLLFASGVVGLCGLDCTVERSWDPKLEDKQPKIVWSSLHNDGDAQILAYITKQEATTQLQVLKIDKRLNISHVMTRLLEGKGEDLLTAAWDKENLTLAAFWSTHELVLYKFTPNAENNQSWAQPTIIRRQLNAFRGVTGIVSTFLHPGQLALAGKPRNNAKTTNPTRKRRNNNGNGNNGNKNTNGANSNVAAEAETNDDNNVLLLWDTNLGIVQGQKEIECTPPPAIHKDIPVPLSGEKKTTLRQALVNLDSTNLFLALEGGVIVCPVITLPTPTLKEALGKLSKTRSLLKEEDPLKGNNCPGSFTLNDILNQKKETDTTKQWGQKNQKQSQQEQQTGPEPMFLEGQNWEGLSRARENNLRRELLDKKKTATASAFNATVRAYVDYEKQSQSHTDNTERRIYFSQRVGVELARRCIEDKLWTSLEILLAYSPLSSQALPELIPVLMEQAKLTTLLEAVSIFDDIPAHLLVQVMKYFVSCNKSHLKSSVKGTGGGEALVEHHDPLSLVLNLIISRPVNRQFMLSCLKVLDVKELQVLIVYLTDSINHFAYNTMISVQAKEKKAPNKFKYPSLKQILLWASMLVDAHYSRFIMVDEIAELIKELNGLVEAHLELCSELAKLQGSVQHILTDGGLPQSDKRDYEILRMPLYTSWKPHSK